MRRCLISVLLVALVHSAAEAGARREIAGLVGHVRDGDTVVLADLVLRLFGLHAPELHQPGGREARAWLAARIVGEVVVCRLTGARSHGRRVAVCHDRNGDLAAQLIAAGLGRDCPRYSFGRYAGLETEAGRLLKLPAYCLPR